MSAAGNVSERAAGLASAARLLAAWWSRPTEEEVERWAGAWAAADACAAALGLEAAAVAALRDGFEHAEPARLLDEHERLLVGPGRAPCPPYESLWRADQPRLERGRLMGASAGELARIYAGLGLRVRHGAHELPDHVAVEWEAFAYAVETGAENAAVDLVGNHLAVWIPPFCAAVAAESREPYYVALARLTPAWTTALAA